MQIETRVSAALDAPRKATTSELTETVKSECLRSEVITS